MIAGILDVRIIINVTQCRARSPVRTTNCPSGGTRLSALA